MNTPLFFLHIPRTAGTTLNGILKDNFKDDKILSVYTDVEYKERRILSETERDRIKLIMGHLFLQSYDPPTIYSRHVRVFTFLRDPIQRLISEYLFLKKWPNNHLYNFINNNNISFSRYISSTERKLIFRGKNFMTRMLSGENFDVETFPEKALQAAKHNIASQFEFVGIQERFNESLLLLKQHLGLQSIIYEKKNALRPEVKKEISEDDIALAQEKNQADIELYNYASTLFSERVNAQSKSFSLQLKRFNIIIEKYNNACELIQKKNKIESRGDITHPKDEGM